MTLLTLQILRLMGLRPRVNTHETRPCHIIYVAQMMQKNGQGCDYKVLAMPRLAVVRSESILTTASRLGGQG